MFGLTNLVAHVLMNMILPDIFPYSPSIAALQSKTIKQQQRKEKGESCECQGLGRSQNSQSGIVLYTVFV